MEKQLLLFNKKIEEIKPKLDLSNLTAEEKKELSEMQFAYNEFYKMDSDQVSNYLLWKTYFFDKWGDLESFSERFYFLKNNKPKPEKENLLEKIQDKINILEENNLRKLKTLIIAWNIYKIKHQYSTFNTNGIKGVENIFNKFKNTLYIQHKQRTYKIKEFLVNLYIEDFEKFKELLKDKSILSKLKSDNIIAITKKNVRQQYAPKH